MDQLKWIFLIWTFSFSLNAAIAGDPAPIQTPARLTGTWKFSEMKYRGERIPLLNPDLILTWTFFANGSERVHWTRLNEGSDPNTHFCEKWSSYQITTHSDSAITLDEETWALNPHNAIDCGNDPDMVMGKKTQTPVEFFENEIWLRFHLGEEDIYYILKPIEVLQ